MSIFRVKNIYVKFIIFSECLDVVVSIFRVKVIYVKFIIFSECLSFMLRTST